MGEEAVAYSLARGKAAAVTRESAWTGSGVLSGAREKATENDYIRLFRLLFLAESGGEKQGDGLLG